MFLDGHGRGFEHFGGVPVMVSYDNLKSAVTKILKGRDRGSSRIGSQRFGRINGSRRGFCRPREVGAHEKGGVVGEVGRFGRNHLAPGPSVGSMEELNELITAAILADDARFMVHRRITVEEHVWLEAGKSGRCRSRH